MKTKLSLIGIASCLLVLTSASSVSAEDLIITDNGANSNNNVSVSSNQQNTVQQTSTATVENNTVTNSNTGNNSASDNKGETAVQTGDTNTTVSSQTSANNSSATINNCCSDQGTTAVVSGNAQGSTNNLSISNNTTNTTSVTNTATVITNVTGSANTGGNKANDNRGPVSIKTGSIYVNEAVKNGPINTSAVSIASNGNPSVLIKISGNARDSVNNVSVLNNKTNIVSITNITNIINNSIWDVNTGNNKANDNDGDVAIKTGDIHTNVMIDNGPINASTVTVNDCGCKKDDNPPVTPPSNPPSNPSNPSNPGGNGGGGGSSSGGGSGAGSVLGAAGSILPATGNYWYFLLLMGNGLLLALGTYLRLRSGRSPAFAFAI